MNSVVFDTSRLSYAMAEATDLPRIIRLLADHGLPTGDLAPDGPSQFLVIMDQAAMVGVAGVETHGADALLRSVCVRAAYRAIGVATHACELLEAYARNLGVTQLYLLTTTAQEFFQRRGFEICSRDLVPAAIAATAEFQSLCPASAVCMTRRPAETANYLPRCVLPLRDDVPGSRMWAVGLRDTMLTYFEVEAGTRFDTHAHDGEQITSVVEGELYFELEGRTVRVAAGEAIAIPRGVSHAVFTRQRAAKAFDAWSPPPVRYC